MALTGRVRLAAALVALCAWTAIFGQMALNFGAAPGEGKPLWAVPLALYGYFTIWGNTIVALVTTRLALGRGDDGALLGRAGTLAAAVVYIVVVGSVYHTLLAGLRHLDGVPKLMDTLLHTVVPIAYPLFWLALVPRGRLHWGALLPSLVVPVAYCFVAMGQGALTGKYAYFFIDAGKYGVGQVVLNIAGLAGVFAVLMAIVIAFDRRAAPAAGSAAPQST